MNEFLLKQEIALEKTVLEFHRQLGKLLWDYVGMSRNQTDLKHVLSAITQLRSEYWQNVKIPNQAATLNKNLEFAGRVADFLELGQLMVQIIMEIEVRLSLCSSDYLRPLLRMV